MDCKVIAAFLGGACAGVSLLAMAEKRKLKEVIALFKGMCPLTPKVVEEEVVLGGPVKHKNTSGELETLATDFLYHLGLDSSMDLVEIFGDVKIVVMHGSAPRAEQFANRLLEWLPGIAETAKPIGKTERFSLFKVGPIVSVSHGMGMPSMSILLHELGKLMEYAGVEDPIWLRCGTSGGLNLAPGSVVVCSEGLNGELLPCYKLPILGDIVSRPTKADPSLVKAICSVKFDDFEVVEGKTIGTDCFYEGQARLDGFFCDYTKEDKFAFLERAVEAGAKNFEMESAAFAAFCYKARIRGAVVCTTLLDRMKGDQVLSTPEKLAEFSLHSQSTLAAFISKTLGIAPKIPGYRQEEEEEE